MWTWILHVTGVDDVSGKWYAFWSGFGSDLGEYAIVGTLLSGLGAWFRHRNCEVHGCWRLGRHTVAGTGHRVCRHHHPHGAPSAQDVLRMHAEHVQGQQQHA